MNEIEFRAKASSGEWVYGNFIHSKRFEGCSNEFRIHNQTTGLESDIDIDTLCRLITIINGIKFFEHDIVDKLLSIRWNNEYATFEFYYTNTKQCAGISWHKSNYILTEVLGNIFDNKN